MRTFFPYFLRWAVSPASFIYRCAVFPLSRNSGCSGARGSDGQYSSNMVHGIGDFCCYSLLLDFVQRVGPGILHLYARTTLQHRLLSILLFGIYSRARNFPCQFRLRWTLLQEAPPLKHSGVEILPYAGVQSDQLLPVESSGSTSFRAVI